MRIHFFFSPSIGLGGYVARWGSVINNVRDLGMCRDGLCLGEPRLGVNSIIMFIGGAGPCWWPPLRNLNISLYASRDSMH